MKKRKLQITISIILTICIVSCIDSAKGNNSAMNFFSFLSLGGAKAVVPYTPEDFGIPTPQEGSALATLPAISENEREVIREMLEDMNATGLLDTKFTYEATRTSRDLLFNRPLSHQELLDKVDAEIKGGSYPTPTYGTEAEILQKESQAADEFFGRVASDLPKMTVEQLIKVRENFTLSLVMIRFVIDYGDPDNGIPMPFLVMAREKAVAIRQKVNEELIRRGVNHL